MAILDLTFDKKTIMPIEDYGKIISQVLKLKVPFNIVQYMLTEHGIVMRISIPDEKVKEVMSVIRQNHINIRNSTITINEDRCVHCGVCISLCNSGALHFDAEDQRCFDQEKCIGCKLCVDACPRKAISFD